MSYEHKPKPLPPCKAVNVKETVKVAEIYDALKNLRYKVALTSFDVVNDGKYQLAYEIQVVNCFYSQYPIVILDKPEKGEADILDYDYALNFYKACVKNYSDLVRAEVRDFQDITIYKEIIGYEETCPKCCMTCKHCSYNEPKGDNYIHGVTWKFYCKNPENDNLYSEFF